MGGKEYGHLDAIESVKFDLNILICGNYVTANIEKELDKIEKSEQYEGKPYFQKGIHKSIKGWKYYFFSQDSQIGENSINFIKESITINKDYKNIILFFSGLNEFTYKDLINFYEKDDENVAYQPHILIITRKDESFISQNLVLKNLNKNLIKSIEIGNDIDKYIHLIKVTSYYNQLGDEIGFPKNIIDERLLEKDHELMIRYFFTFNILLCGKPGSGKSTLANRILGKERAYTGEGYSTLTFRITKYISDKYPIAIYDTPGFDEYEDIEKIKKLIKQKNKSLNEEKNRIHFVFYVINAKSHRFIGEKEKEFLRSLLDQKLEVYFIITHAETKDNVKNYLKDFEINIIQDFDKDKADNLKKNIYPVELEEDERYKKFGIKEVFTSLYNNYKEYKFSEEITSSNIGKFKSIFFDDISTKDNLQQKLKALSLRVKVNFKILAATLENSPYAKGSTNLSTAVIKIISKIYNHIITTEECLDYIKSKGFTDELHQTDTLGRMIEKKFDSIFYVNGPAAKEVESLASSLIKEYNLELDNEKNFYGILNCYNRSINYAIDSLKDIND
jgi:predicted GTPase